MLGAIWTSELTSLTGLEAFQIFPPKFVMTMHAFLHWPLLSSFSHPLGEILASQLVLCVGCQVHTYDS